jgi:hypothetical protein
MNTEDTPTVPGARPCIRRALNRTFDDMAFDTPVNATMYVGVRKSEVLAEHRANVVRFWFFVAVAVIQLGLLALVELSFHGWL